MTPERFWSMVEKTDTCWLWKGNCTSKGYPRFKENGQQTYAHRYSLELAEGRTLGQGEQACHGCDVRNCVRVGPGHIFRGTQADNINDAVSKGRMAKGYGNGVRRRFLSKYESGKAVPPKNAKARGNKHGMATLSSDDVIKIRSLAMILTQRELAERFGISTAAVSMILARKRWTHI